MKLRDFRLQRGLTQAQVAGELGVNQAAVAKWEAGRQRPRDRGMAAIVRWSDGAVQPSDFYDLASTSASQDRTQDAPAGEAAP